MSEFESLYCGRRLSELTKEELIEAVEHLARLVRVNLDRYNKELELLSPNWMPLPQPYEGEA